MEGQSVIQSMFLLSHLWARVLFDSGASHSFIATSYVNFLGLKVEPLGRPLGVRVRIDRICRDCELEISGILLTMDLRVIDMSYFDVILGMDWLTAYQVVIDCDRRRILPIHGIVFVLYFRGISMMLYPKSCTILGGTDR